MTKYVLATNQVYSLISALLSRSKSSLKFGCEPEASIYYIYCSAASPSMAHCRDVLRLAKRMCVCVCMLGGCVYIVWTEQMLRTQGELTKRVMNS